MSLELEHEVSPEINQIEINSWFQQTNDVKYLQGKNNIFNNKTLKYIGEKYYKTVSQVILRWLIKRSIVVIPKSVHDERPKENIDIFDFELSQDFGESLDQLRHS